MTATQILKIFLNHERSTRMPLTKKGQKIQSGMKKTYGGKKGKEVFYASINKGKVSGAEKKKK